MRCDNERELFVRRHRYVRNATRNLATDIELITRREASFAKY